MPMSATARRALYAQSNPVSFLGLLTITHPDLSPPRRLANSLIDVTSRGNLYDGMPFDAKVPAQVEGSEPLVTIIVQNVDSEIDAVLATLVTPPTFVYEVVTSQDPDTVIAGPYRVQLRDSETTRDAIMLTCGGGDPIMARRFPRASYNSQDFPGLSAN